jgi:hypothetical protein
MRSLPSGDGLDR